MSAPSDSLIRGQPAAPSSNVTLEDFLISVAAIAPCRFTAVESSTMGQDLQQFVVHETLQLYQPPIVGIARDLDGLIIPVTNAKSYFAFQIWQNIVITYTLYGRDAAKLANLMADVLEELLKDDLEPMKYCRLRHLGERHVLVVEAFINLQQAPEVDDAFTSLTIMRKGVRSEVTYLEALYLQALANDFIAWMGDMGMHLE